MVEPAVLTVVGLGPGPVGWVSTEAVAALQMPGAQVFVRTAEHPAVAELLRATPFTTFDPLYEQASSLEAVQQAQIERLLAALREGGPVVLAVPGDGLRHEAVVTTLAGMPEVALRLVPGVALGSGAAAAAHLPSAAGLQEVDALALGGTGIHLGVELNPRWPAVVTGIYNRGVASEAKLALQRVYPTDLALTLVHHPGLPEQRVLSVPLAELDRGQLPLDHLTHAVLPSVPTEIPTGSAHGLRAIISRLRAPEIGCPWDREQTHQTLIPYVIEEAYEVVEAIQDERSGALADELGDLLLQVVLHAELADQEGDFELNDVVRAISEKLVRRHPHVFGEVRVGGAQDVVVNWDAIKAAERVGEPPRTSALAGIPKSLPALKLAAEQGRKMIKAGFDWTNRGGAVAKVREELDELLRAESVAERREEMGDLLWMLANLATRDGIDPEEALRVAAAKVRARFETLEEIARERGWESLKGQPPAELLAAWSEAKRRVSLPRESASG